MGAPSITISFTEKGVSAVERGERGIVALLLKDTKKTGLNVIYDITDIPDTLTDVNKSYIKKALVGYQTTPKKVIAYVMDSAATAIETEYTDALKVLKTLKFNWLAAPTAETDAMTSTITTWIKAMRGENKMVKAVLPNATGDTEGIVNVTDSLFNGNAEMTPEEVTPRIAGLIAGCPLTMSITYAPLTDYTGCTSHTTAELDTAVDAGKLVFMWDGEKVKIVRGVNSLTTKTEDKGEQFQKIKVVEIMDMVKDDIRMTAQDDYIGKYSNSYDNKLLRKDCSQVEHVKLILQHREPI